MQCVTLVCPWFGIFAGGAERAVRLLAIELRRRGVDVQVLTTCSNDLYGDWTQDGFPPGLDECDGIPVHRFPVNNDTIHLYREAVQRSVSGKSVPTASQYDFFCHGISSDALVEFVGKLPPEVPVVTAPYFHALNFRTISENPGRVHLMGAFHDEPQFYWKPVRDMFDKARGILFLSPEEKQLAIRTHGLRRGRDLVESPVIGLGAELPQGTEDLLRDEARLTSVSRHFGLPADFFICVGRKEASKGVSKLVDWYEAWAQTRASSGLPMVPLVFLGGGDDSLIPRAPLFRDLGFISENDKFALMKQARATINLSAFESFSLVIMESWLCGTPVVVSAGCEVTKGHVARSGGGYSVVENADFVTALDRLSNTEFGTSLGLMGREHVLENYSWDVVTDRFVRAVCAR